MLSKREKILVRPWEQRKYENHLRKVQSALPVIDNRPPEHRQHVSVKLKKKQKEVERIKKIEHENLILLRKMNYIMRTSRVDNYWTKPLPNFLNRVAIYDNIPKHSIELFDDVKELHYGDHLRKSKCTACTPKHAIKVKIPEDRVPWEPPKQPVGRQPQNRSKSVPLRANSLPTISEKTNDKTVLTPSKKPKSGESSRKSSVPKILNKHKSLEECFLNPQKLVLTRGSLKLCVNFPSDTEIKLLEGKKEKLLFNAKNCNCRNFIGLVA